MQEIARPREDASARERETPSETEIRSQLRSILSSPAFHGSKRCQQFLEYVCERSLVGEASTLKERTIATEVFGRRPESDLGEDTIVRVGAREVRRRLAQFYVSPEGTASRVRIELPLGSYVPDIRYVETKESREVLPAAGPPPQGWAGWRWRLVAACGLVLAGIVGGAFASTYWTARTDAEPFERFWAPVLKSPEPLLLAVGHPLVYHPSLRAQKRNDELLGPMEIPGQRPLQLPPSEVNGSDIIPVPNQYVGFGDMVAATEVAAMLARHSRPVRVRLASNVAFADLRQSPVLLIGALTNRWTMELGQGWRFKFDRTNTRSNLIVDTATSRRWSVAPREDGLTPDDYTLISRIPNSPSGELVIVAAGVKQFGTEAAGRLLSDPEQLAAVLSKVPAGWEHKNLQVVLQTKVIGNTPAQPEAVAWHVW